MADRGKSIHSPFYDTELVVKLKHDNGAKKGEKMEHIVLDMEWNQPFSLKKTVKNPVMLYGEIIQTGAVRLDGDCNIAGAPPITDSRKGC